MDKSYKGIVVSCKDYKENDKLITLFTAERGLILIQVRGVKKTNAKLKFAKELFVFGDFLVNEKNDINILTGCDVIENFYNVSINPLKYFECCTLANIIKCITKYNEQNLNLFMEFVNAVKTICYTDFVKNLVLAKFLITVFEIMGYKLSFSKCSSCGMNFLGKKYLCLDSGEIVCTACKQFENIEIDEQSFSNMRILSGTNYENMSNIKLLNLDKTINILLQNFKYRFNYNITLYS